MDTAQPANPPAAGQARLEVCQHLRSKGMYVTGNRELDLQFGDGNCWCNRTQHALGPDDKFANRSACVPGRACYVALL